MYHPHKQHLHFIGIGGVGMAGISEVLVNLKYGVSGSDLKESTYTEHLAALGAKIHIGHRAENIPKETTVVVISSAVQEDNIEVLEAKRRAIPVLHRSEMLGELMRMKYGIAVAGAHGKTTTTTMMGHLLEKGGVDPTVIVGGRVLSRPSGARLGTGKYLVAESDESDGSFVDLKPAIAIVTNIDDEHLGHYGSFGKLEEAFLQFMSSVPFYGLIVACGDDPVVARLVSQVKRRTLLYGYAPDSVLSVKDIEAERGATTYTLIHEGKSVGRFRMPVPGRHMVSNALAAIAVGMELGIECEASARFLESFPGVARRSEVVGEIGGVTVIDDYGHHPSEIKVTLEGLRKSYLDGSEGRLIVLFQPHRYSRTKELFSQFLTSFSAADDVIIGEIYPAGEKAIPGVSGEMLARAMEGTGVQFYPDLAESLDSLVKAQIQPGDLVVTLGAGSVSHLSPVICDMLRAKLG